MKIGPINIMIGKKDGGPFSKVTCWGIEIKSLFSILLCRFDKGSRDAFHTHAFNSYSFMIKGAISEVFQESKDIFKIYECPCYIFTPKETFHKVSGIYKTNWILTFRGPWESTWKEINTEGKQILTHGRKVIGKF